MIDKATVQQILDAADIVDVVSDFVSLKRRGANYVGLCPFHNEKTPSFSVSKGKGICKCFSCGKGGSSVNFIMEHEQLSYYEALKFLAKKYHIEIKERELTNEEKEAQTERESMLSLNEFASKHFEQNLWDTSEGKEVGLSYFYERGFNDTTIKKFHLGYSLDKKDALYIDATNSGLKEKFLFETGLCVKSQYGSGYDRFKGRVMFPVFNVAGKIIAFGGRTLKNDPAKYVNSPESLIYKKSNELYGLFQAKRKIVDKDKCFLVEGYTDVISMYQSGIENVVASSGTSLTTGQIRMIHRFTNNVTILYDGDAAGIKASLRGIDMLLEEGLNIKVLLLPEGEDPDSFAKSRSAQEFLEFIEQNESDFIKFKAEILLEGAQDDPIKKSAAVQDIVKSIAVIPFQITQSVYTKECSRLLNIDERVLSREIAKEIAKLEQSSFEKNERANREAVKQEYSSDNQESKESKENTISILHKGNQDFLKPYEVEILRFVVRYGMAPFCLGSQDGDDPFKMTILEYIQNELDIDNISLLNESLKKVYDECIALLPEFKEELKIKMDSLDVIRNEKMQEGIRKIQETLTDYSGIKMQEELLEKNLQMEFEKEIETFECNFLEKRLCSHIDDTIRKIALYLASDKHKLSKIHTKYSVVVSEFNKMDILIPNAINNLKNGIITCRIMEIREKLGQNIPADTTEELLRDLQELYKIKSMLSNQLGERVVNPKG